MGRLARTLRLTCLALVALGLEGCATNAPLSRLTRPASAYDRYVASLTESGLHEAALGRDWIAAGESALARPTPVTLPFRESDYFAPERATAIAFRFDVPEGRRVSVDVTFESAPQGRLFVDLFEMRGEDPPRQVATLEPGETTLTHDVRRAGTFVIRAQPELLRGGRVTLVQRTLASLPFPVQDITARSVQSQFGAVRDAGRREHEGIDIFAPRGTPVVAVVAGMAQASTNNLGGNVVWLHEPRTGRTFYYAHLDRWAFEGTMTAALGTVLGYVGNTGNARTTAPHLHFGLYAGGPLDPLPYLLPDDPVPAPPTAADRLGHTVRISSTRAALRDGPAANAPRARDLVRGTIAEVVGATGRAYRVRLPDGTIGYADAVSMSAAEAAMSRRRLRPGDVLRELPHASAPAVTTLTAEAEVAVLGEFERYTFVRMADGLSGWLDPRPSS